MDEAITNEKPQREVPLARKVGRMGMLIHRYYDEQAHRHGGAGDPLRGQGRILALLQAKPETTQRELSYLLDMRQQSLSELLAKLEEKGHITREKSVEDARVTVVRLTEAGAAAAPSPADMNDHADALDCLSDDERAQLDALTEKVTASLEKKLEALGIDPNQRPPRKPDDDRGPRGHGKGPRDKGFDRKGSRDFGGDRKGGRDFDGGRKGGRDFGDEHRGGGHGRGQGYGPGRGQGFGQGYGGGRTNGYGQGGNSGRRGPYRPDDQHFHQA